MSEGPYRVEPLPSREPRDRAPLGYAILGDDGKPVALAPFLGPAHVLRDACNRAFAAGAACRHAPDVEAIAREAAEAVMHEHTNPNLDTGVAAAIIREAIEKATGHE